MSSALERLLNRFRMAPLSSIPNRPDIFVDFEPRGSLFFLVLKNNSPIAATNLTFNFNKPLIGLIGIDDPKKLDDRARDLRTINLFSNLTYLAPGREILVFLDRTDTFLARLGKDLLVKVDISFHNEEGNNFKKTIRHDLSIYLDLPYIIDG